MTTVAWIIALELAVGLVVLAYFGLQVALLNGRIMNAVMQQQGRVLGCLERMADLVATIRVGFVPSPVVQREPAPYDEGAWVPPDRPVGSS